MTAPSAAGLSPLLDQLDEAREDAAWIAEYEEHEEQHYNPDAGRFSPEGGWL